MMQFAHDVILSFHVFPSIVKMVENQNGGDRNSIWISPHTSCFRPWLSHNTYSCNALSTLVKPQTWYHSTVTEGPHTPSPGPKIGLAHRYKTQQGFHQFNT